MEGGEEAVFFVLTEVMVAQVFILTVLFKWYVSFVHFFILEFINLASYTFGAG